MSAQTLETLEKRLTEIETRLAQVEQSKGEEETNTGGEPRGWQRIVGRFADNPLFEDAVRQGRKWRESKDPLDAEEAS